MIFSALIVVVPQGTARRLRIGHGPLTTEAMVPSGTETGETKMNRIVETNELNDAERQVVHRPMFARPRSDQVTPASRLTRTPRLSRFGG